jgi:hypothetical protein
MKTLFLIEDRVGFRDFCCSELMSELLSRPGAEVLVVSNYESDIVRESIDNPKVRVRFWPGSATGTLDKLLFALAKDLFHLEFPQLTFTLRREYGFGDFNLWRNLRLAFTRIVGKFGLKAEQVIAFAEGFGRDQAFRKILEEEKPDAVIYSCYFDRVVPALREAKRLKVPVVFSVSSWDHLTTKGPILFRPDWVFVWSEEMASEVVKYHRHPRNRVSITGALYMDICTSTDQVIPREKFCEMMGIPTDRKIILYALGNKYVEYLNTVFIKKMLELIEKDGFGPKCFLVARANPKDPGKHYKQFENHPDMLVQYPGHLSRFNPHSGRRLHVKDDDIVRISAIYHSDVIICTTSTIIFDGALMDKPIINIMYDAEPNLPEKHSARRYFKFQHAQSVLEEGGAQVVESEETLVDSIKQYLKDPAQDQEGRKRLLRRVITFLDGSSSKRWAENLDLALKTLSR